MNKKELIKAVSTDTKVSQKQVDIILASIMTNIMQEMQKDEGAVILTGIGIFKKVHRKARMARNPQTSEKIEVKAKNVVKFKAGKFLNEAVN